ncbi:MAG: twin-arginine translocation signal domain-containing protein [Acidobacteriota bacterium]
MQRRQFLKTAGAGFGMLGLADVLGAANPLAVRAPHFPANAKRDIYIFLTG